MRRVLCGASVDYHPEKKQYTLSKDIFESMLSEVMQNAAFDEAWYVKRYPDVKNAIDKKSVKTAYEHYIEHGFVEGRLPAEITVDEKYYLAMYQDVRASIQAKRFANAQAHFEACGWREGRMPRKDFSLHPKAGANPSSKAG